MGYYMKEYMRKMIGPRKGQGQAPKRGWRSRKPRKGWRKRHVQEE